jgi:DNA-binding transcriptional LysR family regulator
MDTELLKTFLAVENTRHFGRAAERLHLTPAAISARIRQLESVVDSPLFTRHRNNMTLTPAGERLKPCAEAILDTWNRTLQELPVAVLGRHQLSLGGTPNLWDCFLQETLHRLRRSQPDLTLRAECNGTEYLTSLLQQRQLDLVVLFDPLKLDGHVREPLTRMRMVMISSGNDITLDSALRDKYIHIDWGVNFALQLQRINKSYSKPVLQTSTGRIAIDYLNHHGGALYLPEPWARSCVESGRFRLVDSAPAIEQEVYMTYREDNSGNPLLTLVRDLLLDSKPSVSVDLLPTIS